MSRIKGFTIGFIAVAGLGVIAIQSHRLQQTRSELASVRERLPDAPGQAAVDPAEGPSIRRDSSLEQRIADLEKAVAHLSRSSDYLMDRGQLPMDESKIQDMHARFMDANLSDRDRLRALEALRRNGGFGDDVAAHALAWLQSSTNAGTQRALLQQLDGMTNSMFLQPFLSMASSQDANVRQEAVENLRHFMKDPQVEALLWDIIKKDPDGDVRDEAEQALERGPFTETRIAALQQRGLDPQASLDERLLAMRALDRANADTGPVVTFLADLAGKTGDGDERLKLFRAFDGMNNPALKIPLVNGLQDPNPLIREEAVDALSGFRDPEIKQWLQYVAQNDADPEVRREAYQALQEDR